MAEPDVSPPRPRSVVALIAAVFVGAVIGAAAALSFLKQQQPVPAPLPAPTAPTVETRPEISVVYTPISLDSLPGWHEDSTAQALPALKRSCARFAALPADRVIGRDDIARPASAWRTACEAIMDLNGGDAALRTVLSEFFTAYRVAGGKEHEISDQGTFTGYYEADLRGSLEHGGGYRFPIYGVPHNLVNVDVRDFVAGANLPADVPANIVGRVVDSGRGMRMVPYYTREEIDSDHMIARDADVLVWADDPVAVHILHIQGSGRVTLPDGSIMRIGFAGSNGRAFKGIGSILLEAGELKRGGASMIAVRDWLTAHPEAAIRYMNRNTRYIFFRKVSADEAEDGPIGASNVSLTPGRSLAVDPRFIPLGAPLWLDSHDPDGLPLQRLVVAQDTGAAITGPVRGDFFWGHGDAAFMKAARMRSSGGYVVLVPIAPISLSDPALPPSAAPEGLAVHGLIE